MCINGPAYGRTSGIVAYTGGPSVTLSVPGYGASEIVRYSHDVKKPSVFRR